MSWYICYNQGVKGSERGEGEWSLKRLNSLKWKERKGGKEAKRERRGSERKREMRRV